MLFYNFTTVTNYTKTITILQSTPNIVKRNNVIETTVACMEHGSGYDGECSELKDRMVVLCTELHGVDFFRTAGLFPFSTEPFWRVAPIII